MDGQTTAPAGAAGGFNVDAHVGKLENTSHDAMIYDFAKDQANTFVTALNEGRLPCQPKENSKEKSYCDTHPAKNVIWGNAYHGVNQLMIKADQAKNGYASGDYLTVESAKKAYDFYGKKNGFSMDGAELLKKGAAPIIIMIADKGMPKFQPLYNIDSFGEPQAVREFAAHLRDEKQQYIKAQKEARGETYYQEKRQSKNNGVVVCKSTDPAAFIGQWEAACSTGKGFKVTPQQNAAFVKACNEYISQPMGNGQQNGAYRLTKLMNEAGKYCKEFIPTLFQKKNEAARTKTAPAPEMGR